LTNEQVQHKWDEFLLIEGYKASLENRGMKPEDVRRMAAEFERDLVAKRKWGR